MNTDFMMNLLLTDREYNIDTFDYIQSNKFSNKITTIFAGQGSGKSRFSAKKSFADFVSCNGKLFKSFTSPTSAVIPDYLKNLEEPLLKIIDRGSQPIVFTNHKSPILESYENKGIVVCNTFDALLYNTLKYEKSSVFIVTTNQCMYRNFNKVSECIKLCDEAIIEIDELDFMLGSSNPEIYHYQQENPTSGYSGKFFKKILSLLKLENTSIIGYSGTPTMEHRGVLGSFTDKELFNCYNVPKTKTISYLKDIKSVELLSERTWTPDVILNYIENAIDLQRSENTSGKTIIRLPVGMVDLVSVKMKQLGDKTKRVVMYTSKTGAYIIENNKLKTVGKSFDVAQDMIKSDDYDTLIVVNAGSRGLDVPQLNYAWDLSSSSKTGEQYNKAQFFGRTNRAFGDLVQCIWIREREGARSALLSYNTFTYNNTPIHEKNEKMLNNLR